MKISEKTVNVLKNYSSINNMIVFKEGNVLTTLSPNKTLYSRCVVEETFPRQAVIINLGKFLSSLSLFKNPDVDFKDKFLEISEGKNKIKILYGDEDIVVIPPDDINIPSNDVEFKMGINDYQKLSKAMNILGTDLIVFKGVPGSGIFVSTAKNKSESWDSFEIKISDYENGKKFNAVVKTENFRLMPLDFTVKVCFSNGGIVQCEAENILYIVPCESNMTKFEEQ